MYSCGGPCIAMEGHVYLWRAMFSYGGLRIYSCGGLYIAVEDHV